ncbi:uncharacterized protein LOC112153323 isoform X2 [Oryzias melastigma]|uniref:uncharacterized protein LOC112153323 isoform X2 n=1 Tax=Oryzias melastigma TaxID=30732 RepID=UPI000CF83C18|nr:uncharacterized protein LOC112153323 isoform X2 [Oryzias melastigma]
MTAVIGLLLMLLTVTDGVVTHCDGRQNGAQCYGALGGSVSIQLMDDFSKIHRYQLFKQNTIVMSGGKDKQPDSIINNRYSFIPSNWTFWINNLSRNDSDEYKLGTFDTNGKQTAIHSLQLSVQAPVSSVSLVSECLSQGEMKVSCSSEGGDSPQYRWTLNGKSLTEAELLSGNEQTNIITLKQHVSGRLVCSVWNHVSSVSNETNIRTCGFIYINCTFNGTEISKWVFKESNTLCLSPTTVSPTEHSSPGKESGSLTTSPFNTTCNQTVSPCKEAPWYISHLPILGGVLSALLFFLLVGIVIICKRKKKPIVKERGEHELIYADVRVVKQQSKKQKQRPCQDADVEYGQVKFRERPQHTETPADECVYAKVRK